MKLRITEVFCSLQGESRTIGRPTTFVRLTGCPLRCHYCDTEYAFSGGELLTLSEILDRVRRFGVPHVTVTGGEPLAQVEARQLMELLVEAGFKVSLETSGALSIADIDPNVSVVMDLKTPGSGESHRNLMENISLLKSSDQVKFVITSREDYEWARFQVDQFGLDRRVDDVLFSPSFGEVQPTMLAAWILEDRLPVRMQLQLHKILWGDKPGV
ncbi:MAG: 7-carboxy-7-deazaguanine synthase QueE [Gammaproteobacteria bacterium]|nr:7-carboxy-7-deazaguanine synthase QueE [Gammaproteobacteria bacterium]